MDYTIPLPAVADVFEGAKEMVGSFTPYILLYAVVGVAMLIVGSIIGFFRG